MDVKGQIIGKVERSPLGSKKWIAAFATLGAVIFVYVTSLIAIIVLRGQAAGDIVALSNITIVFIGTLMSIALTGASAVDWKAISSLENIQKTEIENKTVVQYEEYNEDLTSTETITQNINLKEFERAEGVNAPDAKPFGQAAIDE